VTEPPVDTIEVGASPAEIWAILDDPAALGRILPGCESIAREAPGRYVAVLASKVQFMTIRSDVVATLHDADPPHHLLLILEGRPRGLGGSFRCEVPFDIVPNGAAGSRVAYSVGLTLGGSLAGFGGASLTDTLRRQVGELVRNIEREVGRDLPDAPGPAA
jgi:carbon monoxide dehydrogenase subunit G